MAGRSHLQKDTPYQKKVTTDYANYHRFHVFRRKTIREICGYLLQPIKNSNYRYRMQTV